MATETTDATPFRYNADLAADIESRWQDRWEAEKTFEAPNPAGPLADADALAGRDNNLVLFDSMGDNLSILAGQRPDLTRELDGDPSTQEIFYESSVFTK